MYNSDCKSTITIYYDWLGFFGFPIGRPIGLLGFQSWFNPCWFILKNLSLCLLIQFNKPKEPPGFYIHKMFFARVSPLLGTGWEWCWGRMETEGAFSSGPLMEAQSNEMLLIHSPAIQWELVVVWAHEGGMTLGKWMFKTVAASRLNSCVSEQPFSSSKETCSSPKQHCSA